MAASERITPETLAYGPDERGPDVVLNRFTQFDRAILFVKDASGRFCVVNAELDESARVTRILGVLRIAPHRATALAASLNAAVAAFG